MWWFCKKKKIKLFIMSGLNEVKKIYICFIFSQKIYYII